MTYTPPIGRYDALVKNTDGTWSLTFQNSTSVWTFGSDGSLTSMTDDFGNLQTWTYDANGRIQQITDVTSGRSLNVYFGADGKLSAVQDNTGRLVQYAYNTNGTLASVTVPSHPRYLIFLHAGPLRTAPDPGHRQLGPRRRDHDLRLDRPGHLL